MTGRRYCPASLLRVWAVASFLLAGCAGLPSLAYRSTSHAIEAPPNSMLRAAIDPIAAVHPALSGIYPLRGGPDAFAARVALINAAATSIDVQYYIWHDDRTGRFMFDALRRAADRGVRVRLLLDDLTTRGGLDKSIAALTATRNVEVRLFNPFKQRRFRALGYVTDFSRLNRRMHNKSLTVDGTVTIVGGRNIADEYFQAGDTLGYVDFDVLAVGPVVADVSQSFDEFWRSDSAYPASLLIDPAQAADVARRIAFWESARDEPGAVRYAAAIRDGQLARDLAAHQLGFEWAKARLVADDPAKGLGKAAKGSQLLQRLEATLDRQVVEEVLVVSPFFVPRDLGRDMLTGMAQRGVKIRVLTNGAESSDVGPALAAYREYREPLLKAGVEIFELKKHDESRQPAESASADMSLHAKTFGIDRSQIFVGSFNFDPRSANINTEIGLVIDSPTLATGLSRVFQDVVPSVAYQVELDSTGRLVWLDRRSGGHEALRLTHEPGAGFWRRAWLGFLAILPIEWLL